MTETIGAMQSYLARVQLADGSTVDLDVTSDVSAALDTVKAQEAQIEELVDLLDYFTSGVVETSGEGAYCTDCKRRGVGPLTLLHSDGCIFIEARILIERCKAKR